MEDPFKKKLNFFKYLDANNITSEELAVYLHTYIKNEQKLEQNFQNQVDSLMFNTTMLITAIERCFDSNFKEYVEVTKSYKETVKTLIFELNEEVFK